MELTNKRSIQHSAVPRFYGSFLNVLSAYAIYKFIQMSDSKETVVMGVSDALALMPTFRPP